MRRAPALLALLALAVTPAEATFLFLAGGGGLTIPPSGCASGAPFTTSCSAAALTAANNTLCVGSGGAGQGYGAIGITPFWWEVGNAAGPMAAGHQEYSSKGQAAVTANSQWAIASASKWIYGTAVVQARGGVGNLTAADLDALHMTDGYINGSDSCPTQLLTQFGARNVTTCLMQTQQNSKNGQVPGQLYDYQVAAANGVFWYNGAHEEKHGRDYFNLANSNGTDPALTSTIIQAISPASGASYVQPLIPGGVYASSNQYAAILRGIIAVSSPLLMNGALGTNEICTSPGGDYGGYTLGGTGAITDGPLGTTARVAGKSQNWITQGICNAGYSPISGNNAYSIAHWHEIDQTSTPVGDGAYSSPGALGFYPWIDATKTYYGVISRQSTSNGGGGSGGASMLCGRAIRKAFMTGVQQ